MEIYWDLKTVRRSENSVLTVGTFDGVHQGHQYLIRELKTRAKKVDGQATLVTFRPHPQLVLSARDRPRLRILTTVEEKLELLEETGLDRVVVIPFTREFSQTPSEVFVRDILFATIGLREIVIGPDHAFGKDRRGNIDTLKRISAELGFAVDNPPPFEIEGMKVSSTRIRNLLDEGQIALANKLLGRYYFFSGRVVRGDGRGKQQGFPTANLESDSEDKLIPKDGVYAVFVRWESERLKGMMNIGYRPTFEGTKHTVEVHLFDFDRDIYDETLRVECVERIRDEKRFDSSDALRKQLEEDKRTSLQLLD